MLPRTGTCCLAEVSRVQDYKKRLKSKALSPFIREGHHGSLSREEWAEDHDDRRSPLYVQL